MPGVNKNYFGKYTRCRKDTNQTVRSLGWQVPGSEIKLRSQDRCALRKPVAWPWRRGFDTPVSLPANEKSEGRSLQMKEDDGQSLENIETHRYVACADIGCLANAAGQEKMRASQRWIGTGVLRYLCLQQKFTEAREEVEIT